MRSACAVTASGRSATLRPMKKRTKTKPTSNLDPAALALDRQRKRAAQVLLKRRRRKSGQ